MDLLLATRNRHKLAEIAAILGPGLRALTLDDRPDAPPVVEDEPTLEGNARKKAVQTAAATGLWCLADDTGLEVEALHGAPGVHSARYAGPDCDYAANNRKLLEELRGLPPERRRAAFRTIMALASPDGKVTMEEGRLEGVIADTPAGTGGFGYDPLFFVPSCGRTLAQMSLEEKNGLSHRGAALARILPHVRRLVLAASLVCLALPASAGRTEPAGQTIWDQIMTEQATRDVREGAQYLDLKDYEGGGPRVHPRGPSRSGRPDRAHDAGGGILLDRPSRPVFGGIPQGPGVRPTKRPGLAVDRHRPGLEGRGQGRL